MTAYRRRSPLTPAARLILVYLAGVTEPRSYMDCAEEVKFSYWHTRNTCLDLAQRGILIRSQDGKFPKFIFNRDYLGPKLEVVPAVQAVL